MEQQVLESPTVPVAAERAVPRLAEGVELIGQYQGSGYKEPKYILSRADGQVIQLPALLYLLAENINGARDLEQLASRVNIELDLDITAEQVSYLVEEKLRPAGITVSTTDTTEELGTEGDAAAEQATRKPDALLMLKYRLPVLSPRAVWVLAGIFAPLHWLPVVLAMLAAFVGLDGWIVAAGGIGRIGPAATALVHQPVLVLLVLGSTLGSAVFHESGHVSACRYGGARPGAIGVGLYLVWPAMYSTVTDSYRLSRGGRLRTDLGGVYFNVITIVALSLGYLQTGAPWMLIALVLLHVETAWQFLPNVRLDGYYILADLVGVPDLFSLVGPVLKSLRPGRETHPRVAELKPWTRRVMTLWVLVVVPVLTFWLAEFLIVLPRIVPVAWASLLAELDVVGTAVLAGDTAGATLNVANVFLLLVPWVGTGLIVFSIARRLGLLARKLIWRARGEGETTGRPPAWAVTVGAATRRTAWLLVAAVPVALLTGVALVAAGRWLATVGEARIAAAAFAAVHGGPSGSLPWPDSFTVFQVAALQAHWPAAGRAAVIDAARVVFLVVGLLGCLLVWPVARRLGVRAPAAAAAVALCGLPVALHGLVDAGTLAAVWLTLAAALVGRGRVPSVLAAVAAAVGVLTAPLAAVGVLALGAYVVVTRLPARGWSTGVTRVLGAALVGAMVAAVLSTGSVGGRARALTGNNSVPVGVWAGVVVAGLLVVAWSWRRTPALRPFAVATGAMLACAAVLGEDGVTALLVALPALAVLTAALFDGLAVAERRGPVRAAVAAALVVTILVVAPVLAQGKATPTDRTQLSGWIRGEVDPATALVVDPLTAAQLSHDGVAGDRLITDPEAAPAGALTVVTQRSGGSQPAVPGSHPLATFDHGPGGAPTAVYRTGPSTEPADLGQFESLLADNPRLALSGPAADALRRGAVDQRLATVLAALTATHQLAIAEFPAVPGEAPDAPRRTALITGVDGVPASTPGATDPVAQWLSAQQPPYRPERIERGPDVLLVHWALTP